MHDLTLHWSLDGKHFIAPPLVANISHKIMEFFLDGAMMHIKGMLDIVFVGHNTNFYDDMTQYDAMLS